MTTITVTPDKTKLLCKFPYNEEMVARIRNIQGRVWAKGLMGWTFPFTPEVLQEVQAVCSAYGEVRIDPYITEHHQRQRQQVVETIKYAMDTKAVELPADFKFNITPYEHQKKAISLCLKRQSFALFMEMGTGKTKVIVDMVGNQNSSGPVLVVCPVSVMENWKIEFQKNQSHVMVFVYSKKNRQLLKSSLFNVFIINYESAWRIVDELAKVKWGMIVLDESTKIKHRGTKQAKAILKLGSQIPRRYIMTGTPMPNNPLELFNQIRFLDPTIFGHQWYAFRDRYAVMGGYQGHEIRGWKNLPELGQKLSGISFRVLKKDCLDLPEKVYKEYRLDMDPGQEKIYDELAKDLVTTVQGDRIVATVVLAKLMKLRQITSGFVYNDKGEPKCLLKNPKLLQLKEILQEILPRHKVVVWTSFRQEIGMISSILIDMDVKFVTLDGSVAQENRQSLVSQFQTDPQTMVFLGQQHAGGLGITLTAGSYCVFFSNDYSPEIRLQAEDRLHRIGQKNTVTYVDLIIKSSIDTSIRRMLKSKQDLAAQVTSVNLQEVVYGNEIGG